MGIRLDLELLEWEEAPVSGVKSFVTIWPRGEIVFSAKAKTSFNIANFSHARLAFDRTQRFLVFQLLKEQTQGAIGISPRQRSFVINANHTLEKFGMDFRGKTMRYPLVSDETSGLLVAKINEGAPVERRMYAKSKGGE